MRKALVSHEIDLDAIRKRNEEREPPDGQCPCDDCQGTKTAKADIDALLAEVDECHEYIHARQQEDLNEELRYDS